MKTRNIREQKASKVFSMLKKKYEVEFCPFDPTAIIISRITKSNLIPCAGICNVRAVIVQKGKAVY